MFDREKKEGSLVTATDFLPYPLSIQKKKKKKNYRNLRGDEERIPVFSFIASSCLSCSQPRDPRSPVLQVDLKTNAVYGNDANIAWEDHLNVKPGVCTNQGRK